MLNLNLGASFSGRFLLLIRQLVDLKWAVISSREWPSAALQRLKALPITSPGSLGVSISGLLCTAMVLAVALVLNTNRWIIMLFIKIHFKK